ncbi:HAD family hydrolase [Stappia sp. ICDLI1TA098]
MTGAFPPVRAVLFDKDGTLIDFQATWGPTFHALIAHLAGNDEAVMERLAKASSYHLDSRTFDADSVLVAGSNDDVVEAYAEILGLADPSALALEVNAIIGEMSLPFLSGFPDLDAATARLLELGLVLGVATNDSEASARAQMQALGLTDRFRSIIGFDSGHGAKPAPGMVTAFCTLNDLAPGEVVMVGDSLHDMHAGRAAGARTLAVTTGLIEPATLEGHADAIVGSLAAAVDWISAQR